MIRSLTQSVSEPGLDSRWEINGEYILTEQRRGAETMLSLAHVRKRAWLPLVERDLEETAQALGALVRVEAGIGAKTFVVATESAASIRDSLESRRRGTTHYELLDREHARRAVIKAIELGGGEIVWDELDDTLQEEHFPLGYRLRDAIHELLAGGELVRRGTKTSPRLALAARAV